MGHNIANIVGISLTDLGNEWEAASWRRRLQAHDYMRYKSSGTPKACCCCESRVSAWNYSENCARHTCIAHWGWGWCLADICLYRHRGNEFANTSNRCRIIFSLIKFDNHGSRGRLLKESFNRILLVLYFWSFLIADLLVPSIDGQTQKLFQPLILHELIHDARQNDCAPHESAFDTRDQ